MSNDNLIRLSVIRQGGLRLSCEQFIQEYEDAMRRLAELTAAGERPLGAPAQLPEEAKPGEANGREAQTGPNRPGKEPA